MRCSGVIGTSGAPGAVMADPATVMLQYPRQALPSLSMHALHLPSWRSSRSPDFLVLGRSGHLDRSISCRDTNQPGSEALASPNTQTSSLGNRPFQPSVISRSTFRLEGRGPAMTYS